MSMAEPFIPLFGGGSPVGAAPATGAGRLSALAPAPEKQAFIPSLVTLPPATVPAPAPAASLPHCTTPAGETAQPTVTLQHDGGKVTRIRIHCACGQVIDLDCVY
jgi:hypothetical protein